MSNKIEPEALSDIRKRIANRLAIQHARWLLGQPVAIRFWFRAQRSFCRFVRRLSRACSRFAEAPGGKVIIWTIAGFAGAACLAFAFFLVAVAPSAILLIEPERRVFESGDQRVAVALTRITIILTLAIGVFWSLMPGNTRVRTKTYSGNVRSIKARSMLKKPRRDRDVMQHKSLAWVCGIATLFGVVTISGVLAVAKFPVRSGIVASVFLLSVGWLVYRVALRLMRYRTRVFWKFSIPEFLMAAFICMGFGSTLLMTSGAVLALSEHLSLLGPAGFALSRIATLANDADAWLVASLQLMVTSCVVAVVGWYVARDAGTFAHRRRLVASQRVLLLDPSRTGAKDDSDETISGADSKDWKSKLAFDLDHAVISRSTTRWRTWLFPIWFRRRLGWIITIGLMLLFACGVYTAINSLITQSAPVPVVGKDRMPFGRVRATIWVFVSLGVLLLEAVALVDRIVNQPFAFGGRPISSLRHCFQLQVDGLIRLPLQLLVILPLVVVVWAGGVSLSSIGIAIFGSVIFCMMMRMLLATYEVFSSVRCLLGSWTEQILQVGIGLFGYVLAITMMFGIASSEYLTLIMQISLLAVIGLFAMVCWMRAETDRSNATIDQANNEG